MSWAGLGIRRYWCAGLCTAVPLAVLQEFVALRQVYAIEGTREAAKGLPSSRRLSVSSQESQQRLNSATSGVKVRPAGMFFGALCAKDTCVGWLVAQGCPCQCRCCCAGVARLSRPSMSCMLARWVAAGPREQQQQRGRPAAAVGAGEEQQGAGGQRSRPDEGRQQLPGGTGSRAA